MDQGLKAERDQGVEAEQNLLGADGVFIVGRLSLRER